MPCMKCANGKWKYGPRGGCNFRTLVECKKAQAAIYADKGNSARSGIAKK